MKFESEGTCKFCGQARIVDIVIDEDDIDDIEFDSEEEKDRLAVLADAKATEQCTCPESREAFAMAKVDEVLNILCGDHAVENGYDSRADEEQMQMLRNVCLCVYRQTISSAVLNMLGDTIKIRDKDGVIKIKRETKRKLEMSAI